MFKSKKNSETVNTTAEERPPKTRKEEIKHGADLVALVATIISTTISITDVVAAMKNK